MLLEMMGLAGLDFVPCPARPNNLDAMLLEMMGRHAAMMGVAGLITYLQLYVQNCFRQAPGIASL